MQSQKTLIILNLVNLPKTSLIQVIINNLIQSQVLSKEDAEANFGAIVNALHGTDLPTYFKEIKNPLEPFLGVSLDNRNIKHPFGSNFEEISDELFKLLESGKMLPLTSANVWNESDYVKPEIVTCSAIDGYSLESFMTEA